MIQICGTILLGISLICGTWYAITIKKEKAINERKVAAQRNAMTEAMAEKANAAAHDAEIIKRQSAEAQNAIKLVQIKRLMNENERLKKLLKEAEK